MSSFGRRFIDRKLPLPDPKCLPNSDKVVQHYLVGDQAFPLMPNLLRPYPGLNLTQERQTFNYRLSRARQTIENSFGILVARWRVLLNTLYMLPKNAEKVVLACVALHNFLRSSIISQDTYVPANFVDREVQGNLIHGTWRNEIRSLPSIQPSSTHHIYGGVSATELRNTMCTYLHQQN